MATAHPQAQEDEVPQSKPVLPFLALLALASALGVAAAVVLAGVAMLLAAPAYADDGSLLLERRAGLAEAERLYAAVEVLAEGQARVVEVYRNPFAEPLTGIYVYRLPAHAVLEYLSLRSRDPEPQPAILTRREGAALVERTARIAPGETLQVELEYRGAPRTAAPLLTLR